MQSSETATPIETKWIVFTVEPSRRGSAYFPDLDMAKPVQAISADEAIKKANYRTRRVAAIRADAIQFFNTRTLYEWEPEVKA